MKELAAAGPALRAADVAARRGARRSSPQRGEPLKVQLIEEKTAGQTRRLLLHDQGPRHLRRLLRRPARAVDRQAQGVQAAHDVERLLEGRRANQPMQRIYGTAFFSEKELKAHLHAHRGGEEARPPQARARARACSCSTRGRRARRSGCDKGTTLYNTLANYMRERAVPRRLRRGEDAARLQQGALGDVRPLAALPRRTCSSSKSEDEQMGLKAMNCPGHMLVFGSEVRSYRDLPLRFHEQTPLHRNEASGVLVGPHARAAVLAGRRALLRDARSRLARKSSGCCGSCSASTATSA